MATIDFSFLSATWLDMKESLPYTEIPKQEQLGHA